MKPFPIDYLFNYACDKFYRISFEYKDFPYEVKGFLIYTDGNSFDFLTPKGICHIKRKDITCIHPINYVYKEDEKEYKAAIENFLNAQ